MDSYYPNDFDNFFNVFFTLCKRNSWGSCCNLKLLGDGGHNFSITVSLSQLSLVSLVFPSTRFLRIHRLWNPCMHSKLCKDCKNSEWPTLPGYLQKAIPYQMVAELSELSFASFCNYAQIHIIQEMKGCWSLCCTDTATLKWTRHTDTWQIL